MLHQLQQVLSALTWKTGEPPPTVDFVLYFEGNAEEECIAPNQWGEGRPPIAEIYNRFQEIAKRETVERVLVGLHSDWNDEDYADTFPPAENVHVFTTASKAEVESWLSGLHSDGVLKGWPYGKPKNAPEPSKGYTVFSVCWD
jgi:hypothetical protein